MGYTRRPFNPSTSYENQVETELNLANDNFDTLAQAFVNSDPTTGKVLNAQNADSATNAQNSDKVDGFDASQTPAPNVIVPLDSNGVLDLSGTYIKSNVYTFRRIDLTNASSDYMLQVGEEAYISFNNVSKVPLHIATQSGTVYEIDLVLSNNIGTSGGTGGKVILTPNNTTYSNAFYTRRLFVNSNSQSAGYDINTSDSFRLGWAFSSSRAYIVNFTTAKYMRCISIDWGTSNDIATIEVNACSWNDTTTQWTSLGTIVFPQNSTGFVLVRRLA